MPAVTTIRNVELAKVGVWQCSTGEWRVTRADLESRWQLPAPASFARPS